MPKQLSAKQVKRFASNVKRLAARKAKNTRTVAVIKGKPMLNSVEEVVDFLGGRNGVVEKMTRAGHPITANAVTMWKSAGEIPSARHYIMDRIVRKCGGRINPKMLGERVAA